MKILITGGAGFIGTALAQKLHKNGYNVSLLDLSEKFKPFHNKFNLIAADVREYKTLCNIGKYDMIFHLASQTSGRISQEEPELDLDTNIKGTLNICRYAKENQIQKIIFSSSMAVYGDSVLPLDESSPLCPKSIYGCSKISAETFIKMYAQYGIKYTIFRLFNVYGPGQDMKNMKQGMASIFVTQAILGNKIEVTGSLERYRDFIYIDDVVEALLMAVDNLDNEICNVGSGQKTTVKELIDTIIKIKQATSHEFEVINIGKHDGDQFGTVTDSSKLKEMGWIPFTKLRDGLFNLYEYGKKELL